MAQPAFVRELPELLERDEEIAAVRDGVRDAAGGAGRVLVVSGDAGIGKSSLVRVTAHVAADSGFTVLEAAGNELERQLPYSIVRSLLHPLLRRDPEGSQLFAGPARLALSGTSASGEASAQDPVATLHGLHWLVLNLTETQPLALLVDDAHWADDASMRVVNYLAHRVADLPLLVMVAARPTEAMIETEAGRLLLHNRQATHLRPEPLSSRAIGRLLRHVGVPDADGSVAEACLAATGGNPFLVIELLKAHGPKALAEAVARGGTLAELVPAGVTNAIQSRLAHLGPEARALAEAAAILGPQASVARCARLAGLEMAPAADAAARLVRQGTLRMADDVGFSHPLVQQAVYEAIPQSQRERLHRAAAEMLTSEEASSRAVAVQLLSASRTGDPTTVSRLQDAAREAAGQGEHGAATTYLRRALDEPPAEEQRAGVLVQLGQAAIALGAAGSAVEHFTAALEALSNPAERAEAWLGLGRARLAGADWAGAADAFLAGLDEAPGRSSPIASQLEAGLIPAAWVSMRHRGLAEERVSRRLAGPTQDAIGRELAVWSAFQRGVEVSATAEELGELVLRTIEDVPIEELVTSGQTVELATGVLFQTDFLPEEIDLLSRALGAVPSTGTYAKFGVWSYCRSWPYLLTGRLLDALADTEAAAHAHDMGWETFYPANAAVRSMAFLERGDLDAAWEAAAIDDERWVGRVDSAVLIPIARGRVLLARGQAEEAARWLLAAGERATAAGIGGIGPTDWRASGALALAAAGRGDEAERIAEEGLALARRWGAQWPLGVALRTAGLVARGTAGLALLEEAVEHLARSPARLPHARALVDLGAALRRTGRGQQARAVLAEAMDLAHRMGALAIGERAREELVAAGARPRRRALRGVDSLTPSELRTARLAADGRTNREIAQALFVTPKAVEFHLGNVYRKLEIESRRELVPALAAEDSPAP